MELTPEERQKIYEEEKARIEARAQLEREKQEREKQESEKKKPSSEGTTGLAPNVAGLLCYLGAWITGIIFIVLEQKNRWVRFHAAQSLITFGALLIITGILGWIPVVGPALSGIVGILAFILWIVLMVKAYQGEYYKLPVAGDIAEMIVAGSGAPPEKPEPKTAPAKPESGEKSEPASSLKTLDKRIEDKVEDFFERRRAGRITGASIAIAWCIVLLVFFNFFHQYVAFYDPNTSGAFVTWDRYPFFTNEIRLWLPILTAALIVAIIGHFMLIFVENKAWRQVIRIVMDGFGLATVITLLTVFPFDFYVIPNAAAAGGTQIAVTVALALITIGMSIGILVRLINLLVNLLKSPAGAGKTGTAG